MKKHTFHRTMGTALTVLGLAACDVTQTRPAEAPDVDVNVDAGRWPQYDVDWADVNVGTQERTITVPVVRVVQETRQISVPYIDINPPNGRRVEERTISFDIDVPHSGYQFVITEVRAAQDDLWVIGRLSETSQPAETMSTRVSDQVVINAPEDLDIRKIVIGERPEGVNNRQYGFVDSIGALDQRIPAGARVIFQRRS